MKQKKEKKEPKTKKTKEKKAKQSLVPNQKALGLSPQLSEHKAKAQKVYEETQARIEEAKKMKTASTGALIENLPKGSQITARMANFGGGSVSTGGGGMLEGNLILNANFYARGVLDTLALLDVEKQNEVPKREKKPKSISK